MVASSLQVHSAEDPPARRDRGRRVRIQVSPLYAVFDVVDPEASGWPNPSPKLPNGLQLHAVLKPRNDVVLVKNVMRFVVEFRRHSARQVDKVVIKHAFTACRLRRRRSKLVPRNARVSACFRLGCNRSDFRIEGEKVGVIQLRIIDAMDGGAKARHTR